MRKQVALLEESRLSTADKAWMAAVVDLKGTVVQKKNKTRRTPQIVLYVGTKDRRIAARLSALTGTAPEEREEMTAEKFDRRSCAEHCPSPHVHVGDQEYPWRLPLTTRWTVTGVAAAVVLINLAPYMTTFSDYAADVIAMVLGVTATGQGSGQVRATVERLRQLGWEIPPEIEHKLAAAA